MSKVTNALRKVWERMGLKTWADWRNAIHVVTPVLVTLLSYLVGADVAEAIGVFLVTALSPTLAFWNSTSTMRAWVYGLIVPLQGLLVALNVVTQAQFASIASVVLACFSAVLASNHTNTVPDAVEALPTVGEKITGGGRHEAA